jgi:hypothetical protein
MNQSNVKMNDSIIKDDSALRSASHHDLQASIIIANGFNKALMGSLAELAVAYRNVLDSRGITVDEQSLSDIEKVEADCQFCVERIERLLQQLSGQVNKAIGAPSADSSQEGDRLA